MSSEPCYSPDLDAAHCCPPRLSPPPSLAADDDHGADEFDARTIAVSGQGEIQAEPDRAIVTLGVESRKPKMEDARAEVAKTVDAVLKLTRDLKIDPKYVRTTRINVQPEYNWDNNARERNLIGYYVSRQVEVDLRDLDKLGQLLERAIDLGVNQLGDPRLDSSKRRDLEREALAKAVAGCAPECRSRGESRRRAPWPAAHDLGELRHSSRRRCRCDEGDGDGGGSGRRGAELPERPDGVHRQGAGRVRPDSGRARNDGLCQS